MGIANPLVLPHNNAIVTRLGGMFVADGYPMSKISKNTLWFIIINLLVIANLSPAFSSIYDSRNGLFNVWYDLQSSIRSKNNSKYWNKWSHVVAAGIGCLKSDQNQIIMETDDVGSKVMGDVNQLMTKGTAYYKETKGDKKSVAGVKVAYDSCANQKVKELVCVYSDKLGKVYLKSYGLDCTNDKVCVGGACSCPKPQKITGDGTYFVKTGDEITASNGLRVKVIKQNTFLPSYYLTNLLIDVYAGDEKLNMLPIDLLLYSNCANVFGVYLGVGNNGKLNGCGHVSLKVTSDLNGPISSRQDLYLKCMETDVCQQECAEFIPSEAALDEAVYAEGKLKVFISESMSPLVGQYFLNQLQKCYQPIVDYFGVKEVTPTISLRYIDNGICGIYFKPYTINQILWSAGNSETEVQILEMISSGEYDLADPECSDGLVAHELSHLLRTGIASSYYLEEGLALRSEYYIASHPVNMAPITKSTVSLGSEMEVAPYVTVVIVGISPADKQVVFKFKYGQDKYILKEKTYFYLNDKTLLVLESVQGNSAVLAMYERPAVNSDNWVYIPRCSENGYNQEVEFFTGNEFYASSNYESVEIKYESLSSIENPEYAYETGYCFWQLLVDQYGENIIKQFLAIGNAAREQTLAGNPTDFCWMKALAEIAGADLNQHFAKFGLSYDVSYCHLWEDYLLKSVDYGCPVEAENLE